MKKCSGLTTVGLLLLLIANLLLLFPFVQFLSLFYRTEEKLDKYRFLIELNSVIEFALENHAAIPVLDTLFIHKREMSAISDGMPLDIVSRTDRLSILPDSSSISFLKVATACTFSIHRKENDVLRSCATDCVEKDIANAKSFLGIGVDGITEYKLTNISWNDCVDMQLTKVDGFFRVTEENEKYIPSLLIPLKEIVTLYISREGCVRYVQTVNNQTIENQPIACQPDIKSFRIAWGGNYRSVNYKIQFQNEESEYHKEHYLKFNLVSAHQLILSLFNNKNET